MNIGLKTNHVDKMFVYENGVCHHNDQKLPLSLMLIWIDSQLNALNAKEPFVLTIDALQFAMNKDEDSSGMVRSMIRVHIDINLKSIELKEKISCHMDPAKKGVERVWINRGEYLTSGDSMLPANAFLDRISSMMINCVETWEGNVTNDITLYTLCRPDVNMEITFTTDTFQDKEMLHRKLKTCSRMISY